MTLADDDRQAALRRTAYGLLIISASAMLVGRIFSVEAAGGRTPFLSANDRSRWCSVRALVDEGTYSIDNVLFTAEGKRRRDWYSIDVVRHRGPDGHEHFYSSKPPLLATLLAGEYWLIQQATGATLEEHPFFVARIMLLLSNVLPLAGALWLFARWVEQTGETDFGRLFTVAAACFGTYLTTMSVTINNHLPAAVSAWVAAYAAHRIWRDEGRTWPWFALAGASSAFAVANELPALALLAALAAAMAWKDTRRFVTGFAPAGAVVAAAALGTNYLAHGSWVPPYALRTDGRIVVRSIELRPTDLEPGAVPPLLRQRLQEAGISLSEAATIAVRPRGSGWMVWDQDHATRLAIVENEGKYDIREWGNWYEYEGTYWLPERKAGVDRGESSRLTYAFHALFGHHGVFALTPLWLLAVAGLGRCLTQPGNPLRGLALVIAGTSLVCLAFYLLRPLEDRNYGGVSCGFRWMFWFIPLWLVGVTPAVDRMADWRWGRLLALVLLAISIFSATYSAQNPWTHPWIFDYWSHLGWIQY